VNLVSFHVSLVSFHVNLVSFHVNLVSFHVNLVSFHVNLVSFHVNLFCFLSVFFLNAWEQLTGHKVIFVSNRCRKPEGKEARINAAIHL